MTDLGPPTGVTLTGDEPLGARLVANLAFTI